MACGTDFHLHAGKLMEEIRRAPRVNEFAVGINAIAIGLQKIRLLGIVAAQLPGDFRIGADRIAAEQIEP